MPAGSITAANAVYMLTIPLLFPAPVQLQGFSADAVFSTDPFEAAEVQMGVDGRMSAGFVFTAVRQNISLQANSDSNAIFDTWYQAQQLIKDTYRASALILLPAISKKWACINGVLTTYPPIPDAARVLQPRRFGITWESIQPAPV